jgi:hypothetical protein
MVSIGRQELKNYKIPKPFSLVTVEDCTSMAEGAKPPVLYDKESLPPDNYDSVITELLLKLHSELIF